MDPPTKVRTKPARLSVLVGPELYIRLDEYRERTGVSLSRLGSLLLERAMDEVDAKRGAADHHGAPPAQSA